MRCVDHPVTAYLICMLPRPCCCRDCCYHYCCCCRHRRHTNCCCCCHHQGARRFGTDEAPPIDWLSPPQSWISGPSDRELSEMFAYHSVTMANTVRAPLLVFSK